VQPSDLVNREPGVSELFCLLLAVGQILLELHHILLKLLHPLDQRLLSELRLSAGALQLVSVDASQVLKRLLVEPA
jgi:hypothetical protein